MQIEITSGQSTTDFLKSQAESKPETKEQSAQPVEQEAKPTEESETLETTAENTPEQSEELEAKDSENKPKKDGVQKRFDTLTKQREEARREAEALRREIESLKAQSSKPDENHASQKQEALNTQSLTDKPKAENFETHEAFVEALTDWKLEQRDVLKAQKAKEEQVKKSFEEKVQTFSKKLNEFKSQVSDWNDVISDAHCSPIVEDLIVTSDVGPELMYELAKNREELNRINLLNPVEAAVEIGMLKARIKFQKTESVTETQQQIKKTTKAPAPIAPIGKGAAPIKKSLSDPSLTQAEYEALRRANK